MDNSRLGDVLHEGRNPKCLILSSSSTSQYPWYAGLFPYSSCEFWDESSRKDHFSRILYLWKPNKTKITTNTEMSMLSRERARPHVHLGSIKSPFCHSLIRPLSLLRRALWKGLTTKFREVKGHSYSFCSVLKLHFSMPSYLIVSLCLSF